MCSLDSGDLLDESSHLVLLNGATAVLVELLEGVLEVLVLDAGIIVHLRESVLNESLGLFLVEVTISVLVILLPDVVDTLLDDAVELGSTVGHAV